MENSYLHKIKDFTITPGQFKNDNGEMQDYLSVQIVVLSDGKEERLNLSGNSAIKPSALRMALKGADNIDANDAGYNNQNSGFLED